MTNLCEGRSAQSLLYSDELLIYSTCSCLLMLTVFSRKAADESSSPISIFSPLISEMERKMEALSVTQTLRLPLRAAREQRNTRLQGGSWGSSAAAVDKIGEQPKVLFSLVGFQQSPGVKLSLAPPLEPLLFIF